MVSDISLDPLGTPGNPFRYARGDVVLSRRIVVIPGRGRERMIVVAQKSRLGSPIWVARVFPVTIVFPLRYLFLRS